MTDRYIRACARLDLLRELVEAGVSIPAARVLAASDAHRDARDAEAGMLDDVDEDDYDALTDEEDAEPDDALTDEQLAAWLDDDADELDDYETD